MSTPLENLEQQYAAEVLKVDADEGLLKRLERGIRGLKGIAEHALSAQPGIGIDHADRHGLAHPVVVLSTSNAGNSSSAAVFCACLVTNPMFNVMPVHSVHA